jgi:hypothetical protein
MLSGGRPYSHPRDGLALAFATRSFAGSLAADAQGSADQVFETEE